MQVLRLIPHEILLEDFPDSLVTRYVHWLDMESGMLEFRPLEQAWKHDPLNWVTYFQHNIGETSSTKQCERRLVDIHSSLFVRISNVLQNLDAPKHIRLTLRNGEVEAKLVRLHLNFFVNSQGELECREHNAIVDPIQDIGCLYSLTNKLVLRDQRHRTVLIPYGSVRIDRYASFTKVSIEPPKVPRIQCFRYLVDTTLGMLCDSTGMTGSLYLAYLHAVTVFALPDPLTGRSGTAEALRILRQARMKTSFPLDSDCTHLLELLATLTPRRHYHPPGMMVMQRVSWNRDLGELAQHDDFRLLAQEIFGHAGKFSAFYPERKEMPPPLGLDRGDLSLLERARSRHSHFYRTEFGGAHTTEYPQPAEYAARDRVVNASDRSRRVYEVAALIRDWPATLNSKQDIFSEIKRLGSIDLQIRPLHQYTYTHLLEDPMQKLWGSLYSQCRTSRRETETFKLINVFCTIAFGGSEVWHLSSLLAVAFSGSFPEIPAQLFRESVQLGPAPGQKPDRSVVQRTVSAIYPRQKYDFGPDSKSLTKKQKDSMRNGQRKVHEQNKRQAVDGLTDMIINQWPESLNPPPGLEGWQIKGFKDCETLLESCNKNGRFYQLVELMQKRLDEIDVSPSPVPQPPAPPMRPLIWPRQAKAALQRPPGLYEILCSTNAPSPMEIDDRGIMRHEAPRVLACADKNSIDSLRSLIRDLRQSPKDLCRKYGNNLSESLEALGEVQVRRAPTELSVDRNDITRCHERLLEQKESLWSEIESVLTTVKMRWKNVVASTLWPSITILSVVSFLAANKWGPIPEPWKRALLALARCISSLRRCERLQEHVDKSDINMFYKEAENEGCEGWDAYQIPDWLLLEIESNFTIRKRQADVAQRMIAPDSAENAVLQLNMGEGKTTVITPMIAARLADGSQLLRIIVLKPLLRQSVDILSQRLGGLLNRQIYHVPFSRRTRLDQDSLKTLRKIFDECKEKRGILIVLPEQVLSFRLAGLDLESDIASDLIRLEQETQDQCQTIIDESDEVLDPKFQLVYTRGNQQNVDGEADRWEVIQHVLGLIEGQAATLQSQNHRPLYIDQQEIRFPLLHFLKADAPALLLEKVIEAIIGGSLPGVSFNGWTAQAIESARNFICKIEPATADQDKIRETFGNTVALKRLLVLRGLFAHHILHFVLAGKRWLVDYGVHSSRCLMAVPFRAKGVPSENAEFGHADVALTLTCLSYYYAGLTEDQVRQCFHLLKKENDPSVEYERWILRQRDNLPDALHSFNGVNAEDRQNFQDTLYPHLRYQKGIIDFFLSRVVFPKEAKEFPFKLSTSAWDIPSKPGQPLTSGFSGTNDNRYLLPKSMPQKDLPYLLHTNAMVLDQLLREKNKNCVIAEDGNGHQLSVSELLHLVTRQVPQIRVIIDVGAQILESSNEEVAKLWLAEVSPAGTAAAVFFDENDEAMVVDRDGYTEPLLASPFQGKMDLCLVFLDQHHARGVDLKLPQEYRAAVTLGPRLTKDRLVQGMSYF